MSCWIANSLSGLLRSTQSHDFKPVITFSQRYFCLKDQDVAHLHYSVSKVLFIEFLVVSVPAWKQVIRDVWRGRSRQGDNWTKSEAGIKIKASPTYDVFLSKKVLILDKVDISSFRRQKPCRTRFSRNTKIFFHSLTGKYFEYIC